MQTSEALQKITDQNQRILNLTLRMNKSCDCSPSGDPANCVRNCHTASNHPSMTHNGLLIEKERKTEARLFARNDLFITEGENTVKREEDPGMCSDVIIPRPLQPFMRRSNTEPLQSHGNLMTEDDLTTENRNSLRRFESLQVGGRTLTEMTIGGYAIDLSEAAEKAKGIAPMPPSKLPIIFKDDELNFYHHFFQGFVKLFGRERFHQIVTYHKREIEDRFPIGDFIEDLICDGYQVDDTEVSLFLKKVLISTFTVQMHKQKPASGACLIATANLWGFQYIEPGLSCDEEELKAWLYICYGHYKTLWFNTFKLVGVPDFATGMTAGQLSRKYKNERPMEWEDETHPAQRENQRISQYGERMQKTNRSSRHSPNDRTAKREYKTPGKWMKEFGF